MKTKPPAGGQDVSTSMNVPFLDLKRHHEPLRDEIMEAMAEVIDRNAFAGGPFVEAFEQAFAAYCETACAVGVGSGTEALWLVLLALGIGPGDEVITVPSTFIATAEAISFTGARPVFVDIDPRTYNMDPGRLAAAVTPRTKAIIPVHLFGQPADMDAILEVAGDIPVVEDAAQAHGARYKGRRAGSMGVAGCFSFYPGKNLGAWGEAGAVVTQDPDLARQLRTLRDHGQPQKYMHDYVGWNARMDGLQAVVLSAKLARLDKVNAARRRCADRYREALSDVAGILCPAEADYAEHVYHVYAVRTSAREHLRTELMERGVATAIHYPVPLHLQIAYQDLGYAEGDFPVAEVCASEFVSLPMFPELTAEEITYATEQLKEILGRAGQMAPA